VTTVSGIIPIEPDGSKLARAHAVTSYWEAGNVNTNSCSGCKKDDDRLSASRIFAKDNPDFIMSRSDAKEFGFTLYRTGEYCKKGHNSWRYVSTGNCIQCLT